MPSPLVLAPIALALLAEAAWTAVLAGLLQAFALRGPDARHPRDPARVPRRARGRQVARAACRRSLAGAGRRAHDRDRAWSGGCASPEVRSILGERGIDAIGAAIIANLGGFVAGVAFLRGVPYARLPAGPAPDRDGAQRSARRGSRWRRSWAAWSATRGARPSSTRPPARWSCSSWRDRVADAQPASRWWARVPAPAASTGAATRPGSGWRPCSWPASPSTRLRDLGGRRSA